MYNFIKYSNYDYYAYFTLNQIVTHMLQLLQATLCLYLRPYLLTEIYIYHPELLSKAILGY